MNKWENKVAVVTGASSGLGAAIATDLLKSGMIVVGLARRKEKIEELQNHLQTNGKLHAIKCDVSNEMEVKSAFEWIETNLGSCDVLINSAGVLKMFHLTDPNNSDMLRETINTNLFGAIYCVRETFQIMKRRNIDGHIILMNSVSGHNVPYFVPVNLTGFLNVYNTTKHSYTEMIEVWRQEFQKYGTKIKISSLSPGITKTELFGADFPYDSYPHLNPEDVSAAVLYILSTPPNVQVHELILKPLNEQFL